MDYAQQRYYQPASGRFLTTDPLQASAKAGSPDCWNRYPYAASDPINGLDPSGLDPIATPCWLLPTGAFYCTSSVITGSGTFTGLGQQATQLADAQRLASASLSTVGGWNLTLALLTDASSSIASGISDDCWKALSQITGVGPDSSDENRSGLTLQTARLNRSALVSRFDLSTPATRDARRIALFDMTRSTHPTVISIASRPANNAFTFYGSDEIYWRPGENGFDRNTPNWLTANLLHESLHTFGFTDADLQVSFGFTVNTTFTDNITGFLAERCFPRL